jgi:hypothetical protein
VVVVVKRRHRGIYAVAIAAVIGLGLVWRTPALGMPPFLAKYGADALWALMVFLGLGLLLPAWRMVAVAGLAAVISITVEVSQLYHAPWIDEVRPTWLGRLALGDTFAFADIGAFLVGIAVGTVVEWATENRSLTISGSNHAK